MPDRKPNPLTPTGQLLRGEGTPIDSPDITSRQHPAGFDQYYLSDPTWNMQGLTVQGPREEGDDPSDIFDRLVKHTQADPKLIPAYSALDARAKSGPYPFTVNLVESPTGPQPLQDTQIQRHENIHGLMPPGEMARYDPVGSSVAPGYDPELSPFMTYPTHGEMSPMRRESAGVSRELMGGQRTPSINELIGYGGTGSSEERKQVFGESSKDVPGLIAGYMHSAEQNFADPKRMEQIRSEFNPQARREIETAGRHFSQVDENLEELGKQRKSDIWERIAAPRRGSTQP